MQTAVDLPTSQLNRYEQDLVANVREFGWQCTTVSASPTFAYSIGFWANAGIPEVVLFSLDTTVMYGVLRDIYTDAKDGRQFPIGVPLSNILGGGADCFLLSVGEQHRREYLRSSHWFYRGDEFPCVQLVWPDRMNRFPWHDGFDEGYRLLQPDISPEGWIKALSQ